MQRRNAALTRSDYEINDAFLGALVCDVGSFAVGERQLRVVAQSFSEMELVHYGSSSGGSLPFDRFSATKLLYCNKPTLARHPIFPCCGFLLGNYTESDA